MLEILHLDRALRDAGRNQRRLVHQVPQVGSRKTDRPRGDRVEIDIVGADRRKGYEDMAKRKLTDRRGDDKVWRPSKETGKRYPDLSRAYYTTVHEILEGKKAAAGALSDLQSEIMRITGLNASASGASSGVAARHRGVSNEVNATLGEV